MAAHRKPENEKVVALCSSVKAPVKEYITEYAQKKGVTVAALVGMIVTEWTEQKMKEPPMNDPNQRVLPGMKG